MAVVPSDVIVDASPDAIVVATLDEPRTVSLSRRALELLGASTEREVFERGHELVDIADRARVQSALQHAPLSSRRLLDDVGIVPIRGAAFRAEVSVRVETGPRRLIAILRDASDRAVGHDRLQREASLLEAALDAQRRIASADFDVEAVLAVVVGRVRQLTGAERAAVALDVEDEGLVIVAAAGVDALARARVPEGPGPVRRVFESGVTMTFEDMPPIAIEADLDQPSRCGIGVPLEHQGRRLGVLCCSSPRPAAFDAFDVRALELLAGLVGPALAQAREVQRRRQVEVELRAGEARLGSIVETMAEGILIVDPGGVITFANPAAERMLKRPRRALVGRSFRDARVRPHHPDGRALRPEEMPLPRLLASARPIVAEDVRFLRPDRTFLYATISAALVRDAEGGMNGMVLTIADSTERRVAEATRRESEERMRAMVGASLDGVVAADSEGRIVEFNPAAEVIFGRSRAEVMGQPVRLLMPARLRAEHAGAFEDARARPPRATARRLDTTGVRGDGTEFPIELSVSGFMERGRPMFVASARDLSERDAAETARRESAAKSRFLAAMSHELRTPLNSILGFSQLMEQPGFGEMTDRQRRYVGHIQASGRHLLGLINDVLDLSKVAAGEMRVQPERVDLREATDEALLQIGPLAAEKGLQLDSTVPPGLAVLADPIRLSQVVANLLSNAIKFTPAGGGVIRVSAALEPGAVVLTVSDPGIGIPADRLEDIFADFTQVESELNRAHEGTGLGLALTRQLLALMQGTVTAESRPGQGSRFHVRLPVA